MEPERNVIPELKAPGTINISHAKPFRLDNGLSIYVINSGTEPVVKLEFVFQSGTSGSADFTAATATHQLLDSGTNSRSALEIAEAFDYYGSYLQADFGPDWKSASLYSLNRFFPETLDTLLEVLQNASFPAAEMENWKTRNIQSLLVNREKVSWLAKTAFNEALYGHEHPYGFVINEPDIRNLETKTLQEFYKVNYKLENALIIISGNITEDVLKTINQKLGSLKMIPATSQKNLLPPAEISSVKKRIPKKGAVQCGIRIGKLLFSKNHPDYPALQVANTILGGYFGSRLMSNIREDKGYSYGIGSGIHPHRNSGFFFISTEVGKDVCDAAIKEIYSEINRLTEEPVPPDELHLVKNYLIGAFQRSIDGPFSLADRFKGLHLFGLDYSYFENYLNLLKNITPETIQSVVEKHLQPESMTEIISG